MKLKKVMSMLLATAMVAGCLTGCGDKTETKETSESKESTVTSESKESTTASSEAEEEELEYVKLKLICVGGSNEESTKVFLEKVNPMLLEDLNCEIELQSLGWGEVGQQYPLLVSSGEDYDIIYAASWLNYSTHAQAGAYLELTEDMLQEYAPNYYDQSKDYLYQGFVEGKGYMFLQGNKYASGSDFYAVRGDIMKEAGLEDITTGAEMEQYLDYVVKNYPDMNVLNFTQTDKGYPFFALAGYIIGDDELKYHNLSGLDYVTGNAGAMDKLNTPYILDTSDPSNIKLMDQDVIDNYYLTVWNKLKEMQDKGYWEEDVLSKTGNPQDYFVAGTGAAVIRDLSSCDAYVRELNALDPTADARIVRLSDAPGFSPAGNGGGSAINAKSKNWERAMMVVDKFYGDQEYVDLVTYGIEGTHYTVNADGTVTTKSDASYSWSITPAGTFAGALTRQATNGHTDMYYEFDALYGSTGETATHPLATLNLDTTNITNEIASIKAVMDQYKLVLNAGISDDVEGLYEEYKAALDAVGYQKVLDELVKQAQAYYDGLN